MKNRKIHSIKELIISKFIICFSLAAIAILVFQIGVNSIQFKGFERNPFEKLDVKLANYKTIDVNTLKNSKASIEVIDKNLKVTASYGYEDTTGYTYSNEEFSRLMSNHLREYQVRSEKIIDAKGNKTVIVLKQNFSREAFDQLKISSLFYTGIFFAGAFLIVVLFTFLFARSIYKPIMESYLLIQNNISKTPVDQNHVALDSIILQETKEVMVSYNNMLDEMDKIKLEKQEALNQSNRLISNLSHDLKSPITILEGYSDILMNESLSREDELRYYSTINESTHHLSEMVNLLFEQVKFQHSEYALHLTKVDINEFLRSICANYYDIFEKKGFEMDIAIPDETCYMEIDTIHMKRTLDNIFENCLSHNLVAVPVCISATIENEYYVLRFKDDGVGVSKENKDRIFEPFFQEDAARSKRHSGLGLYIAKQVVERHGGSIRLVSEPNYKTVFEIRLKIIE